MDVRSMKAFFENLNKSQQSSQTSNEPVRKPPAVKKVSTACQLSIAEVSREGNESAASSLESGPDRFLKPSSAERRSLSPKGSKEASRRTETRFLPSKGSEEAFRRTETGSLSSIGSEEASRRTETRFLPSKGSEEACRRTETRSLSSIGSEEASRRTETRFLPSKGSEEAGRRTESRSLSPIGSEEASRGTETSATLPQMIFKETFGERSQAAEKSSLPIFQKPMCLISTDKNGNLLLEEEPLKQIEQIDKPLVIVAIAGLYRTGKSYLMNCLAGETKGFPLGNTTESKTKGIWAWCKSHPKHKGSVLLLLDTEGLGDIAKGDADHDNKIFTIATLLCNVLVYNMMTAFNQDVVEKLTFISEMSKNIRFMGSEMNKDEKFDMILPIFVLCLRDFILDIEKDGKELTTDEYLEDCLELKPGDGKKIDKYNRPRECIRKYFRVRKCFTFDRPGDKLVMKQLENVRVEDLSESFREETAQFLKYIYSCKPKVLMNSKPVRGKMFATLAISYISAIRSGAIPDVDDAFQTVARMENERMADEAVKEFKAKLETVELPVMQNSDFNKLYEDIQNAALAHFRMEAMFDSGPFERRAVDEMEKLWKMIKERNCKMIKHYCITQLRKVYREIVEGKKERGEYFVPGGYATYREDIRQVKRQFREKMTGIEEFQIIESLNEFTERECDFENEAMLKDKKLSEEERKREIKKLKEENDEAIEKQQKVFEQKMAEERMQTEQHYKKLESERETYMKREEEKMQILIQQSNEQRRLNERTIEMMKADNERQRNELKQEISRLMETNSKREIENRNRFDRLQAEEKEKYQKTLDTMKQGFQDIVKRENSKAEEYRRDLNKIKASFLQLQQKQTQESQEADRRFKEERKRSDEFRTRMVSLMDTKNENARLKSALEKQKNRGLLSRVFNLDS